MNRRSGNKRAAALCGLFVIAAVSLSACKNSKYEQIDLTKNTEVKAESIQGVETEGESSESAVPESIVLGDAGDMAESKALEADGAAVAGTIPLESDITTDNGFTDTDEIVYMTENLVNIRSGCGTEYSIVAQLNKGDSLKRTGYSEGWSRVLYRDNVCYVSSDFLTKEDPEGETTENIRAQANAVSMQDESVPAVASNGRTVAIDAGHQAKGNSEKEPVGPGSSTMKAKVASGTEGIVTKLPEYKLTLSVSQKLKRILEERGYTVVMIRESNDVNISNAERAEIANKSGASVFVRIHANSLDSSTVSGVLSMCQTSGNPYNGRLHAQSYSLSKKITDSISAATGFKNRGVQETDTMSGINWCEIPVSIVEMGFMSNPEEDQKMAQDEYQEKIAAGIADGIDAYFAG